MMSLNMTRPWEADSICICIYMVEVFVYTATKPVQLEISHCGASSRTSKQVQRA